jgi:hypothetical protein
MTLLQEGRRMRMTWLIGGWVVAWALVIAMPVMAGDGVLEINQTCATETGCFPGDAPGFPVTLNESGSFALTGNLFVDVEATAIEVGARPVDLDLNGFTIEGRGRAIQDLANGSSSGFVRVHGGSIKGRSGISLSEGTIENLMVTTDADGVLCDTCMITNSIIVHFRSCEDLRPASWRQLPVGPMHGPQKSNPGGSRHRFLCNLLRNFLSKHQ